MTEKIECPVDGCDWVLDTTPPHVPVNALASVFGAGVMTATAAFQHSQRIEDVLAQHYDKHTVESFLHTIRRLQSKHDDLARSFERLRGMFAKLRTLLAELEIIEEDK